MNKCSQASKQALTITLGDLKITIDWSTQPAPFNTPPFPSPYHAVYLGAGNWDFGTGTNFQTGVSWLIPFPGQFFAGAGLLGPPSEIWLDNWTPAPTPFHSGIATPQNGLGNPLPYTITPWP